MAGQARPAATMLARKTIGLNPGASRIRPHEKNFLRAAASFIDERDQGLVAPISWYEQRRTPRRENAARDVRRAVAWSLLFPV
jgi:hypothetical protein